SLGEHEVQLATITGLKPRLRPTPEISEVARVKGDARLAPVIARAVADRQHPLPRDLHVVIDGFRIRVSRRDSERIIESARGRHGPHNAQRPYVVRRVLDLLVGRWKRSAIDAYRARRLDQPREGIAAVTALTDPTVAAALSRGDAPPEGWEDDLRS